MVFGEGFQREVRLNSGLIDLGANKNVNRPNGGKYATGHAFRNAFTVWQPTRLGVTFHDKNDKVVTEKKFNRLIPSFRGRIDTTFSPDRTESME